MIDRFVVVVAVVAFACIGALGYQNHQTNERVRVLQGEIAQVRSLDVGRDAEMLLQQRRDEDLELQIEDLTAALLYQMRMLGEVFSAIDFRFQVLESRAILRPDRQEE